MQDPLEGVDPGLKVPIYVMWGAGFAVVLVVWGSFDSLAGVIALFVLATLNFVLLRGHIENQQAERRHRENVQARKEQSFKAPPQTMLENDPPSNGGMQEW